MHVIRWSCLVAVVLVLGVVGCGKSSTDDSGSDASDAAAATSSTDTMIVSSTILCGKCGEQKGSDACCAAGADVCACGMHKGTALCCAELSNAAAGKDICSACGHVAESGHTCDEDCETCADCGLHKGSDACCKLKS